MMPGIRRKTLRAPIRIEGIGLHSGEVCRVILFPAPVGAGVAFECDRTIIPAVADRVSDTRLGSSLSHGGATVRTVEHLMAALHALGCHDLIVQVEGPELPAMDGSALAYVEAIDHVGLVEQDAVMEALCPDRAVYVSQGESEAWAFPWHVLAVTVIVDYPDTVAGRQATSMEIDPGSFVREIAPARTFALAEEFDAIKRAGLAKGGGPENAFLIGRSEYSGPLRFPDEVVRHKTLDLIGDLYLAGAPVRAHVVATRPGHALNLSLAAALRSAADA